MVTRSKGKDPRRVKASHPIKALPPVKTSHPIKAPLAMTKINFTVPDDAKQFLPLVKKHRPDYDDLTAGALCVLADAWPEWVSAPDLLRRLGAPSQPVSSRCFNSRFLVDSGVEYRMAKATGCFSYRLRPPLARLLGIPDPAEAPVSPIESLSVEASRSLVAVLHSDRWSGREMEVVVLLASAWPGGFKASEIGVGCGAATFGEANSIGADVVKSLHDVIEISVIGAKPTYRLRESFAKELGLVALNCEPNLKSVPVEEDLGAFAEQDHGAFADIAENDHQFSVIDQIVHDAAPPSATDWDEDASAGQIRRTPQQVVVAARISDIPDLEPRHRRALAVIAEADSAGVRLFDLGIAVGEGQNKLSLAERTMRDLAERGLIIIDASSLQTRIRLSARASEIIRSETVSANDAEFGFIQVPLADPVSAGADHPHDNGIAQIRGDLTAEIAAHGPMPGSPAWIVLQLRSEIETALLYGFSPPRIADILNGRGSVIEAGQLERVLAALHIG